MGFYVKKGNMKKALVTGSSGFIGSHLVKRLKEEGYWVRGVDIKLPEFQESSADEFLQYDLRDPQNCMIACNGMDEVYNLAADMGGMGFIESNAKDILHNNALINLNMTHWAEICGVKRYFFSSSVCVYPNMKIGDPVMTEEDVYPAHPENEYGWEKLYAEHLTLSMPCETRIARFQNTYGPYGTYQGGREKAPAALCRKVATNDKEIEVWGDGKAVRNYIYVDDLVDGIFKLMQSDIKKPVNIGTDEYVSVDDLAKIIIKTSNKKLKIVHIDGPVGVESRNFSNKKIKSLGWKPKFRLEEGIKLTYNWIKDAVSHI